MRLWIREFRGTHTAKVALSIDNLAEPITSVKQAVADVTSVPAEEQELVYGGKTLHDQNTLQSYGVTSGATLHLLRRVRTAPPAASPLIARIPSFRDALQNPRFVRAVCQVMQNPGVVRELFFTPEVAVSAESRALLEQPNFLLRLGDPTQMANVFAEHPVLADIAQERLEAYLTSYMVAHGHNQGGSTSWPPSIDDLCEVIEESLQQFDDSDLEAGAGEDDELDVVVMDELDHHEQMAMAMAQHQQQAASSGITSNQLASALSSLSSVTSSSSPAQLSPAVQPPTTSNSASPAAITADVFSQALAGALEASSSSSSSNAASSQQRNRSRPRSHRRSEDRRQQLNAMREMGIADEAICLQALEATNGDVMAAVNLIFTDGFL